MQIGYDAFDRQRQRHVDLCIHFAGRFSAYAENTFEHGKDLRFRCSGRSRPLNLQSCSRKRPDDDAVWNGVLKCSGTPAIRIFERPADATRAALDMLRMYFVRTLCCLAMGSIDATPFRYCAENCFSTYSTEDPQNEDGAGALLPVASGVVRETG